MIIVAWKNAFRVIGEYLYQKLFTDNLKRLMISVEIRKERTSMELLEKVLDDKNLYAAYSRVSYWHNSI